MSKAISDPRPSLSREWLRVFDWAAYFVSPELAEEVADYVVGKSVRTDRGCSSE